MAGLRSCPHPARHLGATLAYLPSESLIKVYLTTGSSIPILLICIFGPCTCCSCLSAADDSERRSGRKDDLVQRRGKRRCDPSDKARHLPAASEVHCVIFTRFLYSSVQDKPNTSYLQSSSTIQQFIFLYLSTLRGAYGYLHDCAKLLEWRTHSMCIPQMPANLAGSIHRDKRASYDMRSLLLG
jgi:hypothetical protein